LGDATPDEAGETAGDLAAGLADELADELAVGLLGETGEAWAATLEKAADIPDGSCCSFAC
jgi:hypothetical protein